MNRSRAVRNGNAEEIGPRLVAGEHVLDLLVRQGDLLDGLALVLQGRVVVIDVGGQEELWIPLEALARGEIRDLLHGAIVSSKPCGDRARCRMPLTSRGGPSSSPMLIVVDLDSERAEPAGEHMSVHGTRPSYDVTRGQWGDSQPGASKCAPGAPTDDRLQDQVLGGIDNSLSRLGRRSCTIFCFWAELEDLAGVVGEVE